MVSEKSGRDCSVGHSEASTGVFVAPFCNSLKLEITHMPTSGGWGDGGVSRSE